MQKHAGKYSAGDLDEQKRLLAKLRQIVSDTEELDVFPINARNAAELKERLPRLLGVRHIMHAQQWTPYATNLYILSLYNDLFRAKHPKKADLELHQDLVDRVAEMVSLGGTRTRRAIQAASAFSHLKRNYFDKLSDGDTFRDEDQYYFENILQNKYAAEQFGFDKDDLHLDDEAEEVLFKWAFRYPRGDLNENKNILRKAEDIRLWSRMKKYDDEQGTSFAARLHVENPDDASRMEEVEANFLAHKAQVSPLDKLRGILASFGDLKADTLLTQAAHLKPLLQDVRDRAGGYLAMIEAVGEGAAK